MAARFPDWGWYFVYTREAHPGERVGPHRTFEEKLAGARRLREEAGVRRPILVDDLEGTVHRAYGVLPNMSWVLGRGGIILYKAMWTSASRIGQFVRRFEANPLGMKSAHFYTEQVEVRRRDREEFYRLLERNGPRAVKDFAHAEEIWAERAKAEAERARADRRHAGE